MKLQLKLEFFAAVMHAPRNEVSYALLKQEENETVEYRPVVIVTSLQHYAYDIRSAQFIGTVSTPEVKKTLEPAVVKKSSQGLIFSSETCEECYATLEFYRTYKTVVLNDFLS